MMARLACGDVNKSNYDGFPIHVQVIKGKLEAAVYELLHSVPNILASYLLYYRITAQRTGPMLALPQDIAGHRLFFEIAEGENNI